MDSRCIAAIVAVLLILFTGCSEKSTEENRTFQRSTGSKATKSTAAHRRVAHKPKSKAELLAIAAMGQVGKTTVYDPSYVKLAYPGGDVPIGRGVCTDVVVRAFRECRIDLQVAIHEDMKAAFDSYPNLWGLQRPDRNIDHRRVPNITTFLRRRGKAVPVTKSGGDDQPGDIVVWRLSNGRHHIGIVSNVPVKGTNRYKLVHNIGAGTQLEDVLFAFEITDHFRYF